MILSQTAKTPEHSASWFRTLVVPSFSQSCQVSIFSDYNLNTCKKCKKMWYFYKICYLALQELIGEWILILWLPLYKLEISISWPHSSVTSVPKSDCSRWLCRLLQWASVLIIHYKHFYCIYWVCLWSRNP